MVTRPFSAVAGVCMLSVAQVALAQGSDDQYEIMVKMEMAGMAMRSASAPSSGRAASPGRRSFPAFLSACASPSALRKVQSSASRCSTVFRSTGPMAAMECSKREERCAYRRESPRRSPQASDASVEWPDAHRKTVDGRRYDDKVGSAAGTTRRPSTIFQKRNPTGSRSSIGEAAGFTRLSIICSTRIPIDRTAS